MQPFIMLLWKEWREQVWKSAAFIAMTTIVPLITWLRDPSFAMETTYIVLGGYALIGGLFIGMGVAAGERVTGTERFLHALPVRSVHAMQARLLAAAMAGLLPIAALILVSAAFLTFHGGHEKLQMHFDPRLGMTFLAASAGLLQVLLWTVFAGMRRPTELSAGVGGAAVLLLWVGAVAVLGTIERWLWYDIDALSYQHRPMILAVWLSPAGMAVNLASEPHHIPHWVTGMIQMVVLLSLLAAILWRATRQRGSLGSEAMTPPRRVPAMVDLPPPPIWWNRWTALAWKAARESLPAALLTVGVAALLVIWSGIAIRVDYDTGATFLVFERDWLSETAQGVAMILGVVLALVLGIGLFVPDLRPRLLHFWRSRPIEPAGWYWSHLLTGALLLVLAVVLPVVATSSLSGTAIRHNPYLLTVPVLHVVTLALAVMMACAVRQPIYAGALGFGLAMLPWLMPAIEPTLDWLYVHRIMEQLAEAQRLDPGGAWRSCPYLRWLAITLAIGALAIWGGRHASKA